MFILDVAPLRLVQLWPLRSDRVAAVDKQQLWLDIAHIIPRSPRNAYNRLKGLKVCISPAFSQLPRGDRLLVGQTHRLADPTLRIHFQADFASEFEKWSPLVAGETEFKPRLLQTDPPNLPAHKKLGPVATRIIS